MTTTVPATQIPTAIGLATVGDHLSTVFSRPAPVPRRFDVQWISIQPSNPTNAPAGQNDTWNPAAIDTAYNAAHANGVTHIVIDLTYCSMTWAGGSGDGHVVPRDAANGCRDYANISRLVLKYWHDQGYDAAVTMYLEAWNEPQNGFMGSVTLALRATYIKILQARADACRNGNIVGRVGTLPHFTNGGDLWTGGTGAGPSPASAFGHYGWHAAIIDADPDCFDHITIHAYSGPCPLGSNNGYDGLTNGAVPLRPHLDAASRTDAQINSTEGGWFWRDDGTPTNPGSDCSAYGSGGFPANIEVDVTTLASRITAAGAKWFAKAASLKLGIYFLYQQDNGTAGNDGFNHAGLYQYASSRNGAAVLDHLGNPAPLNAFLALPGVSGGDTTPPVVNIIAPTPGEVVRGSFAVAAGVTDNVTPDDAITVRLSKDAGATFPITPTYTPAGVPFGYNQLSQFDSTDGSWPDGSYTVEVKATDQAGNHHTSSVTFTVDNSGGGVPVVTSVTPATGPPAGGTNVVIRGSGFTGVTGAAGVKVQIPNGPVANATSYTVVNDTTINAVMPPVPTQTASGPPPILIDCGASLPNAALLTLFRDWGGAGARIALNWDSLNPNHDGHSFSANYLSRMDAIVAHCNGLTLLAGVTPANGVNRFEVDFQIGSGSTFGSSGTTGNGEMYNEDAVKNGVHYNVPKLFAEAAANVAIRYKTGSGHGVVYVCELGNEPNHQKWDDGNLSGVAVTQKGFAYVKCFAHFSRRARAGGATSILTIGGLGGEKGDSNDASQEDFTAQCYAANVTAAQSYDNLAIPNGIKGLADRWNDHPYCYFATPEEDVAAYLAGNQYRGWAAMVFKVWPILDAHGDGALLVEATEFGQPHDNVHSLQDAANSFISAVKLWKTYSAHAGALYLFQGVDNPGFKQNGVPHRLYGIFDVHLNPNEPYATTFKQLATGVTVP